MRHDWENIIAKWLSIASIAFFSIKVFAQEVPAQVPDWQMQMQNLLQQVQSPWVAAIALVVIEFLMRFAKTTDPKSLLYVVANGLKLFAKLFETFANFIDQYLQRLKK